MHVRVDDLNLDALTFQLSDQSLMFLCVVVSRKFLARRLMHAFLLLTLIGRLFRMVIDRRLLRLMLWYGRSTRELILATLYLEWYV